MNPARHGSFSLEDDRLGRAFDRRLMVRLLRFALPYRGLMAAALVLLLVTSALGLAGPFIVKWAIDGPLRQAIAAGPGEGTAPGAGTGAGEGTAPGGGQGASGLYLAVGIYCGAVVLGLVLRFVQGMAMSTVGQRVMHDLRLKLFSHLQRMPLAYFDRNPVGRLTTRVTNDIEALNQLFTSGVVTFLADLLVLAGITAALIWVNRQLALVTLMVLPPLGLVTAIFRRSAQKHYRAQRGHLAHLNAFSQEALQGLSIIQLFTREAETSRRFREINDRYLAAFQRTVFCYSLYFPAVELIAAGALAAILWRGAAGLQGGLLTFGEFYLFWHYLGKFMAPVRDMAERYNVLQSAMAAAERIFKILDTPPSPAELPPPGGGTAGGGIGGAAGAASPLSLRGQVEFQDVSFSYGGAGAAGYAIQGVSFSVEPGETLAVVGATGAGKSTLVSLLLRFYEPQKGRILIDGRDIREIPVHQLRRRVGLVLQDAFLFSRTIRENLLLGRDDVTETALTEALRRTHAGHVLERLPGGLEAVLGERGMGLSAGEKQLVAFGRALAGNPDILVLDEATAHIDPATEALLQDGVRELLRGRTAIVIAHRLSTVRQADRILVLHKGEVRESGTHQELLARRGIYERLYRLQFQLEDERGSASPDQALEAGKETFSEKGEDS